MTSGAVTWSRGVRLVRGRLPGGARPVRGLADRRLIGGGGDVAGVPGGRVGVCGPGPGLAEPGCVGETRYAGESGRFVEGWAVAEGGSLVVSSTRSRVQTLRGAGPVARGEPPGGVLGTQ